MHKAISLLPEQSSCRAIELQTGDFNLSPSDSNPLLWAISHYWNMAVKMLSKATCFFTFVTSC